MSQLFASGGQSIGVSEEIFKEIIVENFPNMEKEIVNQVQEVQKSHTGQTQTETCQDTY